MDTDGTRWWELDRTRSNPTALGIYWHNCNRMWLAYQPPKSGTALEDEEQATPRRRRERERAREA